MLLVLILLSSLVLL